MSTQPQAMPAAEPLPAAPLPIPRALFVFALFYGGMVCIAGVLGAKQVALGPLAVEAGIFGFILLVVIASTVAELYGARPPNRLVRLGFIPLIVVDAADPARAAPAGRPGHVPAAQGGLPDRARPGRADDARRASIAYGISQTLNIWIFSKLSAARASCVWLRAMIASVCSQIVDTLLFITDLLLRRARRSSI